MLMLKKLITPKLLDVALEWALTARKDFPDSDSIWDVAFNWPTQKKLFLIS